ncbi:hypothetical protein SISNIDRAFT_458334 [Sistotremastrum niveocremeum HHB9708]|uniref:Inositol-pentakisphosphate 2-kinase n=1 Tax=Sistotremastrum niveocremeum HHB9708 TaxID=1314777 RepID=A0A164QVC2_9AGAM|nr:hypothetical protein SISNIDRAFT_458334 [Sistotremastrum niveocremeum HHB9708]
MLSLSDTVPSDWKYLNEGGRHIVFSYVGSPHVDFDNMVLRLRKINPDEQHTLASADNTEFTRQFHDQIISKLVPAQYLPEMHTVQLDPEWLGALARQTEPARPAVRAAKDQINVNAKHGIVCADLVGGKEWAVEIKPKWAFLPNPNFLSPATFSTKTKHCRFCIHSAVRSLKGKGAATGYCPLDLFSKEESRVRKALYELWDTWNSTDASTNNLRIFVSGTVTRPTDVSAIIQLQTSIYQMIVIA